MSRKVHLPESADQPGIIGCYQSAAWALGQSLGGRFRDQLNPKLGEAWFRDLKEVRRKEAAYKGRINLLDLSFCLSEILDHSQSPLRQCIPSDHRLYTQLEKMRRERNDWVHCDVEPNLANLKKSIARMRNLAETLELDCFDDLAAAVARIDLVSEGKWVRAAAKAEDVVADIRAMVAATQPTDKADVPGDMEAMRAEAAADLVEAMRPMGVSRYWTLPLPTRMLKLTHRSNDLRDPSTARSCKNELGPNADQKIRNWLKLLPTGGEIFVDESGAVVASVYGALRIIGYVGELPELPDAQVQGFFTGRKLYLQSGRVLESMGGAPAAGIELNPELELEQFSDGELKVTDCGDIGFLLSHENRLIRIARIAPRGMYV